MAIPPKKLKRIDTLIGLVFLFALFFVLRFWHVADFFVFGVDEEYQALLAWEQVKNFHITFIGVSASNVGLYLGPGLTYIGWMLLNLSRGDPVIFGYFASLVGVITVCSIYYVMSKLYDKYLALLAMILYGCSFFIISYDRRYWPLAVPLMAVWLFYLLARLKKDPRLLVLISALVGLSFHIHLSLMLFVPVIIWLVIVNRRSFSTFTWLASATLSVVMISPLIVFDVLHNFDNIRAPFKLLFTIDGSAHTFEPLNKLGHLLVAFSRVILDGQTFNFSVVLQKMIGAAVALIVAAGFYMNRIANSHTRLAGIMYLLFFIISLFFPGPFQVYYVVIFFPFIVLGLALFLSRLSTLARVLLIAGFIVVNLYTFSNWKPIYGLETKKRLIEASTAYIKGKDFYLDTGPQYVFFGGWRYLFKVYGKTPVQSSADQLFGWIYQDEIATDRPTTTILVRPKNTAKPRDSSAAFASDAYQVFVIEPKTTTTESSKTIPSP